MRATLNRLNEEKEALLAQSRSRAGVLGRIRQELGLPKDTPDDEQAYAEALRKVRAELKPGQNGQPQPGQPGQQPSDAITQEVLNQRLTEVRQRTEMEFQDQIRAAQAQRDEAIRRWKEDRIEVAVTTECQRLGLSPPLVLSILRDPRNAYEWTTLANEQGNGVLIAKKGDTSAAPFYSTALTKYLQLGDALAVVAKDHPGVLLVQPRTGSGAGVGAQTGPAPLGIKQPSDMTPEEKVAGAFKGSS